MYACRYLLPLFIMLLFASIVHANIIHVPDDSTTIQGGINGAVDGDTVLVADGTYTGDGNRDIDFTGKAIVLMSENGPEVTIIDCEGDSLDPHRGFYFHSGEDLSSVVQGFTIKNGYTGGNGGGIYCYSSSPTVTNCTFRKNTVIGAPWYLRYGGGMSNISSNPTITNCTFIGNSAGNYGWGSGMGNISSNPTITNCTFIGNSTYPTNGKGGGMHNYHNSNPTVSNCVFIGNSAGSGDGGGMDNLSSSPTLTNCTFIGNEAYIGGGMYNDHSSQPTLINCTFSENLAGYGGGISNYNSSSSTVTNCTFSGNSANWDGGGMYNWGSDPTVSNCTFSGNSAVLYGGGMFNGYSISTVTNCILWGDLRGEITNYNSDPIVTYCDVEGSYPGEGNIDVDPLFVSFHGFDYLLGRGSPCIDAGDPTIEDGRSWPIWYNNGLRSDMGTYGGPGNVGWLQ